MAYTVKLCKMRLLFLLGMIAFVAQGIPVDQTEPQGFEKMGQLSESLSKQQFDYNINRNELDECRPVTVIFARGTIELGNVGSIAGPPFFNALEILLGSDNVAIQGVDYPATIEGYLKGGNPEGATKTAELINRAASQCPDTQIVLSGYSQGAQVVHSGVEKVAPESAARVAAVVFFGDPKKDQALANIDASKIKTYCFPEDLICKALPVVDTYHLSYAVSAVPAAKFVKSKVRL